MKLTQPASKEQDTHSGSGDTFFSPRKGSGIWGKVLALWYKLLALEASPPAIAGGLAVGVFFGFTPFWGMKTLLTVGSATLLRVNPVAAFIALTAFDFLTPLVPVMLRFQYDLGYWILSNPHQFPPKIELEDFHPQSFLHWEIFKDIGIPLFLGSLGWAIPATICTYFSGLFLLQKRKERKTKYQNL